MAALSQGREQKRLFGRCIPQASIITQHSESGASLQAKGFYMDMLNSDPLDTDSDSQHNIQIMFALLNMRISGEMGNSI